MRLHYKCGIMLYRCVGVLYRVLATVTVTGTDLCYIMYYIYMSLDIMCHVTYYTSCKALFYSACRMARAIDGALFNLHVHFVLYI